MRADFIAPLGARVCWVALLVMACVYAAYSTKKSSSEALDLLQYGGLSSLTTCLNQWNWHVVFLTSAFAIAMVESLLAFRAPLLGANVLPGLTTWIHLFWQTAAVLFIVLGMFAIISGKKCTGAKHMYSVHAYTGALVLGLFAAQYLIGLAVYVIGKYSGLASAEVRKIVMPWHKYVGRLILFGGIGACVNGWADIQMMNVDFGQPPYRSATVLGSTSALILWALATCMAATLFRGDFPENRLKSTNHEVAGSESEAMPVTASKV